MIRVYNFHVVVRCDYMTSHHTITSTSPRYAAQTSALRHFYNRLKDYQKTFRRQIYDTCTVYQKQETYCS